MTERRRRLHSLILAMAAVGIGADGVAGGTPLEPPDGLVYHGTSPNIGDDDPYMWALDDPSLLPAVEGMHGAVPGTRPQNLEANTRAFLERQRIAGRIAHLSYSLSIGDGQPVDDIIATSTTYDHLIRAIGRGIRDHGEPVFVRIGFEFNGAWNGYHPGLYPVAFRRFVDLLRAEGATNIATIWCYEPDAPADFDATGPDGKPRWYPGDAYVDWFGIDLFQHGHFVPQAGRDGGPGPYPRTLRFLEMARERGKPVYLSELSAVDVHILPDAEDRDFVDAKEDWMLWFEPFFSFLSAHPEIKGFNYMSQNFLGTKYEQFGWGNARIQDNSYLRELWVEAIRDARFVHASKDRTRPASTFDPPPPLISNAANLRLSGTTADDLSGIDRLFVTYEDVVTRESSVVQAVVSCDASRRSCTFTVDAPAPGLWDASARARDRAGNIESPGPAVARLLVLP